MTRTGRMSSPTPPVTRTFAMSDVVDQYREIAGEADSGDVIYDTLIVGGGAAGAGVLRDLASRGNASAILVDRGTFGGETSSKTGKAIHPGIRYLRMAFHRLLLAFRLRTDPKIKQTFRQNLRGAWLDLTLVWYGTRERKILLDTTRDTVEEIPNVVFVLPDSPEKKWAVFFGISLYDLFTTLWAWCGLTPRFSRVKLFFNRAALDRELPHLQSDELLGGIRYWDGKANNDKILVLKAIRDAYYRGTRAYPIRALSHVEVERYEYRPDEGGYFLVTLVRRFPGDDLPARVTVRARTITNAAGPWVDEVRNRTAQPDGRRSVVYSRGSHLEATNRFIHQSLSNDPRLQVGLVPLNAERQHYLRPFQQHGLWYIQCTTTDRQHADPDLVVPMEDEIEELLRSYNHLVEKRWQIDRRDIFNVFCGIRPLASGDGGEIDVQDISRMFRIVARPSGGGVVRDLINVKLTEFRWAGRKVGDMIASDLRKRGIKRLGGSTTHRLPFLAVVGEERFAPSHEDHQGGDHQGVGRRHGDDRIGDRRHGDRGFVRAKVAHYVSHQMASSYQDYLLNTGAIRDAVVFDEEGRCGIDLDVLDLILDEMRRLLRWSDQEHRRQWETFREIFGRNMTYTVLGQRVTEHVPASVRACPATVSGPE